MLEWYAYYESWSKGEIVPFNIFDHGRLLEDLQKAMKKIHVREDIPEEKEEFLKILKRDLMYYYWSKCEWEIILSAWINSDRVKEIKIDVYDQIMLNWHIFSEYVWANRKELKPKRVRKAELRQTDTATGSEG